MPIDFSNAWKTGVKIVNETIALLPNLVLAIIIFAVFLLVASFLRSLARRTILKRRTHEGLAILFGRLIQTIIAVVGFLIALSVVAPSFQASDLIKLLGISTVAIGFAFQNILQNFLAGILLLLEEPFQIGDLISVTGIEGNIRDVQTRATVITTKEGRKVVIPNAVLFTNPVAVSRDQPKTQ
jgi:small-conductance mechanosensitive channel